MSTADYDYFFVKPFEFMPPRDPRILTARVPHFKARPDRLNDWALSRAVDDGSLQAMGAEYADAIHGRLQCPMRFGVRVYYPQFVSCFGRVYDSKGDFNLRKFQELCAKYLSAASGVEAMGPLLGEQKCSSSSSSSASSSSLRSRSRSGLSSSGKVVKDVEVCGPLYTRLKAVPAERIKAVVDEMNCIRLLIEQQWEGSVRDVDVLHEYRRLKCELFVLLLIVNAAQRKKDQMRNEFNFQLMTTARRQEARGGYTSRHVEMNSLAMLRKEGKLWQVFAVKIDKLLFEKEETCRDAAGVQHILREQLGFEHVKVSQFDARKGACVATFSRRADAERCVFLLSCRRFPPASPNKKRVRARFAVVKKEVEAIVID